MLVSKVSKIVLALFFGFSSVSAVIVTEAANPAAPGTAVGAASGESAPAAAQGYRGRYYWHGRRWGHRRWHGGYWGPHHHWHPGFWVYF